MEQYKYLLNHHNHYINHYNARTTTEQLTEMQTAYKEKIMGQMKAYKLQIADYILQFLVDLIGYYNEPYYEGSLVEDVNEMIVKPFKTACDITLVITGLTGSKPVKRNDVTIHVITSRGEKVTLPEWYKLEYI